MPEYVQFNTPKIYAITFDMHIVKQQECVTCRSVCDDDHWQKFSLIAHLGSKGKGM